MTTTDNVGGLPELPEPVGAIRDGANIVGMTGKYVRLNVSGTRLPRGEFPIYTAEQMRAYGELCRAAPAGSGEVMDAIESLAWAEEYFEQRADAEFSPDVAPPHGNEEMVLLVKIQEAAALLRKLQQGDKP